MDSPGDSAGTPAMSSAQSGGSPPDSITSFTSASVLPSSIRANENSCGNPPVFVNCIRTTPPATSAGTPNEYSVASTSTVVASGAGDGGVPASPSDEQAVRSNEVDPTMAMSGRLIGHLLLLPSIRPPTVRRSATPSATPRRAGAPPRLGRPGPAGGALRTCFRRPDDERDIGASVG